MQGTLSTASQVGFPAMGSVWDIRWDTRGQQQGLGTPALCSCPILISSSTSAPSPSWHTVMGGKQQTNKAHSNLQCLPALFRA